MVVAAVVGTVVSVAGSAISASNAASATRHASDTAAGVQYAAMDQQKTLTAPYRALGESAIGHYQDLLGLGKKGPAGMNDALAQTPGYQFTLDQALKGATNSASATGMGLSGNTLFQLEKDAGGLASTTYQNAVQNDLATINVGESAATGTSNAIGAGASNLANIAVGQGNNLANISMAQSAATSNAITGGVNSAIRANTNNALDYGSTTADYTSAQNDYAAALQSQNNASFDQQLASDTGGALPAG